MKNSTFTLEERDKTNFPNCQRSKLILPLSLYSQEQSRLNYKNTATSKTELISFLLHKDTEILDLHLYLTTK